MRRLLLVGLLLLGAGCRSASTTETPAAPVAAERVTIPAADGLTLVGTYRQGAGDVDRPAVLLLHMLGSNRQAWDGVTPALQAAGFTTLALDMRGSGETGGAADWVQALDDVARACSFLRDRPGVDALRVAVVGGSIGANMALLLGAAEPEIVTVVALSPGLDYRGVQPGAAVEALGARPLLLVASSEDRYAAASATTLAAAARGAGSRLVIYDGAGHGTAMLDREPALTDLLLTWLEAPGR